MIYISKGKEPRELGTYRTTTPNATYSGFQEKASVIEKLLQEQGFLCAYCMQRIAADNAHIEHYLPQAAYPKEQLNYGNMLAVCKGETQGIYHCDKTIGGKGSGAILSKLNPLHLKVEQQISYTEGGKLLPVPSGDAHVVNDLEKVLNLNNEHLQELRKARLDVYMKSFRQRNSNRTTWTRALFEKEISRLRQKDKDGKLNQFAGLLIQFLADKARKPKYQ